MNADKAREDQEIELCNVVCKPVTPEDSRAVQATDYESPAI